MRDVLVDPDRRVDPARLTALLGLPVTAVEVVEDSSGSANRLRLRLTYGREDTGLPERMFLKRNLARFGFPVEMYSTEVRVYHDVLPGLGLEQPDVYAIESAADDVMFTILMEDVALRPGVRVGSVLDPTTADEVDSVLDTLARLHAVFWGAPDRIGWTKAPRDNAPMQFWREIGPRLTRTHLTSGHRAAIVDPVRWPLAEWWPAFDRLIELDSTGPPTFLHGDVHAGNLYYVAGGPGGLLDWQLALRGSWALDVSYLLITALSPADRVAHERDLLGGYLERLRSRGVDPPSPDEAWWRYRQNVLYGVMMWLITPEGVHAEAAQATFLFAVPDGRGRPRHHGRPEEEPVTQLGNKVVVVTGAAGGIGSAVAAAFAATGASVAVWDVDAARAASVAAGLGDGAVGVGVDITARASVEHALAETVDTIGPVDVLVNNAGIDTIEPFLQSEERTWERIVAVNYLGTVRCCHVLVPGMVERGHGSVVNIASDAGRVGSSGEAVYSGTKGAVIAFSKSLAREVAASGVRVNAVCPGPTDTPLLDQVAKASQKLYDGLARAVPMRRIGQPTDIAPAVVFLASDGAGYITGQTLSVSGGLTMA